MQAEDEVWAVNFWKVPGAQSLQVVLPVWSCRQTKTQGGVGEKHISYLSDDICYVHIFFSKDTYIGELTSLKEQCFRFHISHKDAYCLCMLKMSFQPSCRQCNKLLLSNWYKEQQLTIKNYAFRNMRASAAPGTCLCHKRSRKSGPYCLHTDQLGTAYTQQIWHQAARHSHIIKRSHSEHPHAFRHDLKLNPSLHIL